MTNQKKYMFKYLISKDEAVGFGREGFITGRLKAYDKIRNIGLMYFYKNTSRGECGCYTLVRKRKNEDIFERYSEETWVNTED